MKLYKTLKKYHQEHLLSFKEQLSDHEMKILKDAIMEIPFKKIREIYLNSYKDEKINTRKITPINYHDKKEIDKTYYEKIGNEYINQYAIITLAGGAGTRLQFSGLKGAYQLNIAGEKISLFGLIAKELENIYLKTNCYIPWLILTSPENNEETIKYFEKNNYFSYPKDKIMFFKQGHMPILDIKGNIVLEKPHKILFGSDGNGQVFTSLSQSGCLEVLIKNNIKYVQISNIDNILCKVFDPIFVGLMAETKNLVGVKSFFKEDPNAKEFVFCKYKNYPKMLDYTFISEDITNRKDDKGRYLYRDIFSGISIFHIDALKVLVTKNLPYHRAYKNYNYINCQGIMEKTSNKNAFKFEKYIFDGFSYFDNLLIYRVDKETEFAPIKNKSGSNSPDTAI